MCWLAERELRPTASRPHVCDQCSKPIPAGERYYRCDGLFEGKPRTYKAHLDCADAADEVYQIYGADGDGVSLMDDVAIEPDWYPFFSKKYPAVANRLWPEGAP